MFVTDKHSSLLCRNVENCDDTQHDDTQHNDTQHDDTQHNYT